MDIAIHEFPVSRNDSTTSGSSHASVDYGRFMAFLEGENGQIICLHQGHEVCVVYESPCLPLTPPNVCTPYDDRLHKQQHGPPAGSKFRSFKEVCYLYTNYPEERVPLPLACDLINQSETVEPQHGSAMTFVPCTESSASYIGYLVFASGPDLCTLTIGGVRARIDNSSNCNQSTFREWSCDHAPLSVTSIEAYTLPGKIHQMHTERVQGKVLLCCRSDYHVTLFEVFVPPSSDHALLHCIGVYSGDSAVRYTQLSPCIAGELVILCEGSNLFLRRKSGELTSLPTHHLRFILCCFGSQPRCLLLATPSNVYSLDIRDGVARGELVTILEAHPITCLSRDIAHPFRVLVATDHTLFLLDIRQPCHTLLAIQHQLTSAPNALSSIQTFQGNTMVLLTSAKDCESVVVCYNGRHSPPYFAFSPHSITTPREQLYQLRGVPFSSCLPLVESRFFQPTIGAVLMSVGKDNFAAIVLTSVGDTFYQCWHYSDDTALMPPSVLSLSPSLSLGYSLWLSEASKQQQELSRYRDLPTVGTVDMDPIVKYLVSSSDEGLCLRCHYMHSQHFPDLKLHDYIVSTTSLDRTQSTDNQHTSMAHSSQPAPSTSISTQRCCFCSELFGGHSVSATRPLPSNIGGLESLRQACAVREPQTELECALASQWITGGSEIQRSLLQASATDDMTPLKMEEGDDPGDRELPAKATPTQSHVRPVAKIRRIGF